MDKAADSAVLRVQVVDSHTCGEPTRVVIGGGPSLQATDLAAMRDELARDHDWLRRGTILEPRGSDAMVGALLVPPKDPQCSAGVIFYNNVGYLGMCGHGMIGVVVTLGHLGRLSTGQHRLETPVGTVSARLDGANQATIENVPSYRYRHHVEVQPEGLPPVRGDVAWGGNWFFLVDQHPWTIELTELDRLIDITWRIRQALEQSGVTGADGALIDHIELFGPPSSPAADGRSFVLCPGRAYDRSPCGTGTSAKLACLVADGVLREGQMWRQEGIVGGVFEATARIVGDRVVPTVTGSAYVTGAAELLFDPHDPFRWGITGPTSGTRPAE